MNDSAGKHVLVTGSSSVIGAGTALEFARQGATLTITGRVVEALQRIANEIKAVSGKEPLQLIGELTDEAFQKRLIDETIEKFGRLDVLVNNAGMGTSVDNIEHPDVLAGFDKVYALNVRTPLNLIHLAVPHLENTKGNVINISSVAAYSPVIPIYSSSKAALDMLTKAIALQLAPKGIRVNSVNPGPVSTGIMRSAGLGDSLGEALFRKYGEAVPLKFTAQPSDIAHSVVFLANDKLSRNVTGTIFINDSGAMIDPGCVKNVMNDFELWKVTSS